MTSPKRRFGARLTLGLLVAGAGLAGLLAAVPGARATTGGAMTLSPVGQLGGGAGTVAVADGRAYLAVGRRVQVFRLSARREPEPVGLYATDGGVGGVAAGGGFAYVLVHPGVLDVVDVAVPERPVRVGSLAVPDGNSLVLAGTNVYVAAGNWLVAVDVADPREPAELGRLALGDTAAIAQVVVAGGVAYVAADKAGLVTVDVSDPRRMVVLGRFQTSGNIRGVALAGELAYLGEVVPPEFPPPLVRGALGPSPVAQAEVGCSLVVVDVHDPAAPRELHRREVGGMTLGPLLWYRDRLYVQSGWYGGPRGTYGGDSFLAVFDLAVATEPALAAEVGNSPGHWLAADRDVLYEAGYWGGLRTLDVGGPWAPRPLGRWRAPLAPRAVAAAGGLVYVGDNTLGGLWVVDASDPGAALPGAFAPGPESDLCGGDCALAVSNGLVYAADSNAGLVVFGAGPPNTLQVVSTLNLRGNGNWMDIAVGDGTAYLVVDEGDVSGRRYGGIFVLDVSDRWRQPVPIAHIDGFRPVRVALDGAHHLVAVDLAGWLWVVDVTDPAQPRTLSHLTLPDGPGDLVARDGYAYVGSYDSSLTVVDLHAPAAPVAVGHVAGSGDSQVAAVTLLGSVALVNGKRLVDISQPDRPVVVDEVGTGSGLDGARIADQAAGEGVFVLADEAGGLLFERPMRRPLPARAFLPWTAP